MRPCRFKNETVKGVENEITEAIGIIDNKIVEGVKMEGVKNE